MQRTTGFWVILATLLFSLGAVIGVNAFTGQTTRVSLDSAGVPLTAGAANGVLAADGRYVVFQSSSQVWRHDRRATTVVTALVSVSKTGFPSAIGSRDPSVSADGRYVVFSSFASDLADGDRNGSFSDVYVRDMLTNSTRLVSASSTGAGGDKASGLSGLAGAHEISDDGRYVVFTSLATDLLAEPYTGGQQQIYVKDLTTGDVVRASLNETTGATAGDRPSSWPAISGNGRVVAFASVATNLSTPSASGIFQQVFVRDLVAGTTNLEAPGTLAASRFSTAPTLSSDGRYLAFVAEVVLDSGDLDRGTPDVYLRDRTAGTTVLASRSSNAVQGANSLNPSISADGRWVAFDSLDETMVSLDTNVKVPDVFLYDRDTETVKIVSLNDADEQSTTMSFGASLSADGHTVLFASAAPNLVTFPPSTGNQLYVRNLVSNQAPVLPAFGNDVPLLEAQPLQLTWRFSDADSTSWTGTVIWGDGSTRQPLALNADKTFVLDHLYAPGPYDLTVAIKDDAGATGSLAIHVVVTNMAPLVNLISTTHLALTQTLDISGTYTDPGSNETYSATVDYGDGTGIQALALGPYSAPPLVAGSFTLHHTYAAAGTYNVAVILWDGRRGGSTSATMTVKVNQAPVIPAFGKDITRFENEALHLTWEFTDNDDSTSWTATVDYGDGSGAQPLTLNANKTYSLDHLWAPGAYNMTVAVTDDAGATGSRAFHVVVSNDPPMTGLPASLDLAFARTLDYTGAFTDRGSNETYSATVNYGDGTGTQQLALGPYDASPLVGGSFTLHHTYAAAGTYTASLTISDSNGGSTTVGMTVKVGVYSYEWLDPLADIFVVGRNLPVKFTVRGPDGSFVLDQSVQVNVVDSADRVKAGPFVFGDQPSRSVTVSNQSYHVNVDTRDLAPGMYWLRVQFSSPTLSGEFRLGTTGTTGLTATTPTKSRAVR